MIRGRIPEKLVRLVPEPPSRFQQDEGLVLEQTDILQTVAGSGLPAGLFLPEKRRSFQIDRIRQQPGVFQFRIIGEISQGQVQLPLPEQGIQLPDQGFRQVEFHMGIQGAELLQDHRQQGFAGNPGEPQPDLSTLGIPDIVDLPEPVPVAFQHGPGHPGVDFSCLGQIHPAGFPDQQGHPRFLFHHFHDPAQGRLGKSQTGGSCRNVSRFTDRQEIPEIFFMEHGPSPFVISFLL